MRVTSVALLASLPCLLAAPALSGEGSALAAKVKDSARHLSDDVHAALADAEKLRGELEPQVIHWTEEAVRKLEAEEDDLLLRAERHYRHAQDQAHTTLGWLASQLGFISRAQHRWHHIVKEQSLAETDTLQPPIEAALDSIAATRNKYNIKADTTAAPVHKASLIQGMTRILPGGVKVTTAPISDELRRKFNLAGGCHGARKGGSFGPRGRRGRFAGRRQHRFAARARHFVRFHLKHNLLPMMRLLLAFGGAVVLIKALTRAAVRANEGNIRLPTERDENEVVEEKAPVTSEVVEVVVEKQ